MQGLSMNFSTVRAVKTMQNTIVNLQKGDLFLGVKRLLTEYENFPFTPERQH